MWCGLLIELCVSFVVAAFNGRKTNTKKDGSCCRWQRLTRSEHFDWQRKVSIVFKNESFDGF